MLLWCLRWTMSLPLCQRVSEASYDTNNSLAREEGLEPPTCGFGDRCSSQLSYSRIAPWPQGACDFTFGARREESRVQDVKPPASR